MPEPTAAAPEPARSGGFHLNRGAILLLALAILIGVALFVAYNFLIADIQVTTPGAGQITFGTGIDSETLEVTGERSTFAPGDNLAFSAVLLEPAGTRSLRFVLARAGSNGGQEQVVTESPALPVSDPDDQTLALDTQLELTAEHAGEYVMRVYGDDIELAEGRFSVSE